MKNTVRLTLMFSLLGLACLVLVGCAASSAPIVASPAIARISETSKPFLPTPTNTLVATVTPTFTWTPSPTVFATATSTPENYVLAEKGYDIADVRISYPREDRMIVSFKYHLDESHISKPAFIV